MSEFDLIQFTFLQINYIVTNVISVNIRLTHCHIPVTSDIEQSNETALLVRMEFT